jgi:hypothetical protein
MSDLFASLTALRRAALMRAADEYGMRYSPADIHEALGENRKLRQGLRRLLAKQPGDIRVGYSVRRFSSAVYRRLMRALDQR